MSTPLSDLRVLDFSDSAAGAYCAKIMACLGADVIKVEAPGAGDPLRHLGGFGSEANDPERSPLFLYLNTGKKGVTLDTNTDSGRDIFKMLVAQADVVVETFGSEKMGALGLSYSDLRALKPDLVMTSITGFSADGPYHDYQTNDLVASAMGGVMYLHGTPSTPPLKFGGLQPSYQTGLVAYISTLVALYEHLGSGEGQQVCISEREVVVSSLEGSGGQYSYHGLIRRRGIRPFIYGHPFDVYPCRNGHVFVIPGLGNMEYLALLVEQPNLAEHPLFTNRHMRQERPGEFDQLMLPWLMEHDKQEVEERAQEMRLPFGAVLDFHEVLEDPQLRDRESFAEIDHPVAGRLPYPKLPYRMSGASGRYERAPLLGEHNQEVYTALGCSADELERLAAAGVI